MMTCGTVAWRVRPAAATTGNRSGMAASTASPGGSNSSTTAPATGWARTRSTPESTTVLSSVSTTVMTTMKPAARAASSMPWIVRA